MNRSFTLVLLLLVLCSACLNDHITAPIAIKLESYPIPGETFFPEGIAYDAHQGVFYTGSIGNGDILKVDVQTGNIALFASGSAQGRPTCNGLKLDAKGRLWVCGGTQNKIQVLNPDGSLLKNWDLTAFSATGFINDCILDDQYVYFTDSWNQQVYRTSVAASQPGEIERWLTFTDAQIPYASTGVNANGIEMTPDGQYLILVISPVGKLYRIGIADKSIAEIQLSTPVTAGDGLWLEQNTLYVSRNALNQLFPVTLSSDYLQGTVGTGFGDNLLFNTTMAKAGPYFLVVNGQLNRRMGPTPPVLPFTVSRVLIP
ncbi:SMP-30/gluconolactonase/LRE family protein [Larkinella sp. C7]|uniref:SMP-30/gluconolactonase/LRE family protein n=1 Tax=Larkinella sp. C7 TaxID=2576607 RepID=UPI0011111627|nr:SMP-30/gluconolactonase/LRE family protein [Larkinella sp. C7]